MEWGEERIRRAQGCLLGQLAGDALGAQVEFRRPEEIRREYPSGVRDLEDGGTWDTLAGQPTDDSEMALLLARTLVEQGTYRRSTVLEAYRWWLASHPFDCGSTVRAALAGRPTEESQANGALMRVSPLGIFGARHLDAVGGWAREDAALTHPNPVCLQANALFARALAWAVSSGPTPRDLYERVLRCAREEDTPSVLMVALEGADLDPPADFLRCQGTPTGPSAGLFWGRFGGGKRFHPVGRRRFSDAVPRRGGLESGDLGRIASGPWTLCRWRRT